MTQPKLYIIAGCNGAGKTTASINILPEVLECREFVNADEIAYQLNPGNRDAAAMAAGRIMLTRIEELIALGKTFAIETTLSTKSYRNLVLKAKEKGYRVILLYFWLDSPTMAQMRVSQRVKEGGHNIPTDVIERRYWRGLQNLFHIFMPIVNDWSVFDNNSETKLIANSEGEIDLDVYEDLITRVPWVVQMEVMKMTSTDQGNLIWDKINKALEFSYAMMLQEKATKQEPVVISENGNPVKLPAKKALSNFWLNLIAKREQEGTGSFNFNK